MEQMKSPEMFKESLDGSGLYKLELEKSRIQNEINNISLSNEIKDIYKQYLKQIEVLLANEINIITNREPFKLTQLKYTKYHWMSGEITNGCPITTSIEIKPEMLGNKWKVDIIHKYMLEVGYEEKIINKNYDLPSQEVVLEMLEKNDLRDLKNNYFSNDKIQKYSHWELEYNHYFKISGTYDYIPEQVKKVIKVLNCEDIINDALSKVAEKITPIQDKQKELYSIAESIYKKIERLPVDSEFRIGQFFNNYEFDENEKINLCEQVISYCLVNDIKVVEKISKSDLELPWNILRIRK